MDIDVDNYSPVVIDLGSGTCKVGLAADNAIPRDNGSPNRPCTVIPSVVGRPRGMVRVDVRVALLFFCTIGSDGWYRTEGFSCGT